MPSWINCRCSGRGLEVAGSDLAHPPLGAVEYLREELHWHAALDSSADRLPPFVLPGTDLALGGFHGVVRVEHSLGEGIKGLHSEGWAFPFL